MKYYLIVSTTVFVDPHGTPDYGGISKSVEYTDEYEGLDLSLTYDDDMEVVDVDQYEGSQDGYNAQYTEHDITEISEEQYIRYKYIIEEYDKI